MDMKMARKLAEVLDDVSGNGDLGRAEAAAVLLLIEVKRLERELAQKNDRIEDLSEKVARARYAINAIKVAVPVRTPEQCALDFSKQVYEDLCRRYPFGTVPMEVFNRLENQIRPYMRSKGLRVIYRGPRKSNNVHSWSKPSMTRRCDATGASIVYSK